MQVMLIEFSVGNYRSFKERVTFSMVAANIVAKDKELDENNVFAVDKELKLLKSAAIYGANASGKSNLAKALSFMRWFMVNSSRETQSTDPIDVEPFRLSTETEDKPSYFELVFLMDGKRYRYGFEANQEQVISEWLYYVPKVRETKLFERKINSFKISKSYEASGIQKRTRDNALFLSVSAQFNVGFAEEILGWVISKLGMISELWEPLLFTYTIDCLMNNENKSDIVKLIKKLDLGIDDIQVEKGNFTNDIVNDNLTDRVKHLTLEIRRGQTASIKTIHKKFDKNGNDQSIEKFDFRSHESEGTQKLFTLAGTLIKTLKEGDILVVDELDARLHPLITTAIVSLFNSKEANPNNAQLIFMTHDTNLLSNKLFRRDQIWFTEKNRYGATDLYSLAEYKIRNDASFESDYIKGKYGAIPYIGDLSHLVDSHV
ncbi:ATP-binding protein [Rivularia sp. UHCC 0363]|uniref:AAA family ATPase n=1 Tax=Rivularia sp. UHCC 0363 TaxID=3110244 RepID=UPI002B20EEB8|nr:ATP-binding protein [Rivularia sp. UHCC 0363]MEA5597987.1 ATP-binding protein [Rivularia sp. UHCC 0363]